MLNDTTVTTIVNFLKSLELHDESAALPVMFAKLSTATTVSWSAATRDDAPDAAVPGAEGRIELHLLRPLVDVTVHIRRSATSAQGQLPHASMHRQARCTVGLAALAGGLLPLRRHGLAPVLVAIHVNTGCRHIRFL